MKLTTELLEKIRACSPASKALADSGGSVEVDAAFVARFEAEHPDWLVWLMGRWVEGLSALLAAGAEVNAMDGDGLTPLHLAAENCHSNVVALLLAKGAKINVTAQDHATPLHLAAQEGCTDVVEVLLDRSAKINLRDNQNRTPLRRAEQWHQDAVAQLLKQHGGTE